MSATAVRRATLYRELLGLAGNPFPDTAIASYEEAKLFDPDVHPQLSEKMARVFLGSKIPHRRKVTFLWSLGSGPEARGYGKSAYLMWIAQTINADYGKAFLKLCDYVRTDQEKVVALYASFSTVEALSLSGILHSATREFLQRDERLLSKIRLLNNGDLFNKAYSKLQASTSGYDSWLLDALMTDDVAPHWRDAFSWHQLWHQQRWGRRVFATLVAVLKSLGVRRILLLVDQLEDFAGSYPSYKHYRDFGRLAEMCIDDPLFSDCLQVVLTMHPRVMVAAKCWEEDKLGPFPDPNDEKQCVIIRQLTPAGLTRLVSRYLSTVRVGSQDGTSPFTSGALERLCALTQGRPGAAISALHTAIEDAVDNFVKVIDVEHIEEALR